MFVYIVSDEAVVVKTASQQRAHRVVRDMIRTSSLKVGTEVLLAEFVADSGDFWEDVEIVETFTVTKGQRWVAVVHNGESVAAADRCWTAVGVTLDPKFV